MNMRYLPHTEDDIREMLKELGRDSLEELLLEALPEKSRRTKPLNLPEPLTEWELVARFKELARRGGGDWNVYLGAGSQSHYIPAVVPYLASRQEFLTSYTPYQPELSQGTLQAIFEFQTLISRMTGLPVTNASMYDGATAMAETALMAQRITKRRAIAVSELAHPHWRSVLATYLAPMEDVTVHTLAADAQGRTDYSSLENLKDPAVVLVQSPNFLGVFEDVPQAASVAHAHGALLGCGFSEAFALGLTKAPGDLGADIVFGEGQSLGLSQGFGGPTLGLMSCKKEHVRQIPGRLVGQTTDKRGRRGFVLTLATREQHIRRSKAVSNICSNAGHCALTATIFMGAIGGSGFRNIARINRDRAEYLKSKLVTLGFEPVSSAATFNEFAMIAPERFTQKWERLKEHGILFGCPLERFRPAQTHERLRNAHLFGVTETRTRADIDAVVAMVR